MYPKQLNKSPNYAINWLPGDNLAEVINTETGKAGDNYSRLSKQYLFSYFCQLLGRNAPLIPASQLGKVIPVAYRDGKTAAFAYQEAKSKAVLAFQEQNLGAWVQVPPEMDMFGLHSAKSEFTSKPIV